MPKIKWYTTLNTKDGRRGFYCSDGKYYCALPTDMTITQIERNIPYMLQAIRRKYA